MHQRAFSHDRAVVGYISCDLSLSGFGSAPAISFRTTDLVRARVISRFDAFLSDPYQKLRARASYLPMILIIFHHAFPETHLSFTV
jgi:hypothetical protein